MEVVRKPEQVILILGKGDPIKGRKVVLELTGQLTQHVTNWIAEGKFPARYWLTLSLALRKHGYRMLPSVCGQEPPPAKPAKRARAS